MDYDAIPIRRSYEREVVSPIARLQRGEVATLRRLRYGSRNYPLLSVQYPVVFHPACPTVLLSGGVHGDEPAGVHAVVEFLEQDAAQYADRVNLCCFPCVNPSGFEADTRTAMTGLNCNRIFGTGSDQEEVRAIEHWLQVYAPRFRLAIDLHENPPYDDDGVTYSAENPRACYLYETMPDVRRRIGRALIEALPEAEVCQWPTIYGDANDRGVIAYPEACGNSDFMVPTSLDAYVKSLHVEHTFTFETPTVWSLERRIAVQRLWICRALDLVLAEEGRGVLQ